MVAVALVAVLAMAGLVTVFVLRSRTPATSEEFVDVSSRLEGTGATPAASTLTGAAPAPPVAAPVASITASDRDRVVRDRRDPKAAEGANDADDDADDEPVVDRFRAPGERARRSPAGYQPTVPRKPMHLLPSVDALAEAASDQRDGAGAPADRTGRSASVADAEAEHTPDSEPQPAPEPVIVLDDHGAAVVLTEEPAATETSASTERTPGGHAPATDPPDEGDADVDEILQALIQRLGVSAQDAAEVAAELVERPDIDEGEVVEALSDLVERADPARGADPVEELVLFSELSDQVPRRPGQLTHLANLPALERRRVIVRVLCLLVARSEESLDGEAARPAVAAERADRGPARSWPVPVADEPDENLPARRRLARARR
jgi:hypothetical protein